MTVLDARTPREVQAIRELISDYDLRPELADDLTFDLPKCLRTVRMVAAVRAAMRPRTEQPLLYR
jgi:hypothetical protein